MKSSFDLPGMEDRFAGIAAHDRQEIDNPDPYQPSCRNYLDRIQTIVSIVEKAVPPGASVAEIGAAQGNMSLLLAEQGYRVTAVDINPMFLEYSRMKYDRGDMTWVLSNIEDFKPSESFDAVILGEVIEHCAWPEKIVSKVLGFVKSGGILVITTPNGERLFSRLPNFSAFDSEEKRQALEKRQFGPDGEDHLFLFTVREMKSLVPNQERVVGTGYLGGTLVFNRLTHHLFRILPLRFYARLIRALAHLPIFNRFFFQNVYMVVRKTS
jgi:2-polyprenyl-6-hydroxyphenyl methylase/3-demethylubiquinone-9 3-methyltransferase